MIKQYYKFLKIIKKNKKLFLNHTIKKTLNFKFYQMALQFIQVMCQGIVEKVI